MEAGVEVLGCAVTALSLLSQQDESMETVVKNLILELPIEYQNSLDVAKIFVADKSEWKETSGRLRDLQKKWEVLSLSDVIHILLLHKLCRILVPGMQCHMKEGLYDVTAGVEPEIIDDVNIQPPVGYDDDDVTDDVTDNFMEGILNVEVSDVIDDVTNPARNPPVTIVTAPGDVVPTGPVIKSEPTETFPERSSLPLLPPDAEDIKEETSSEGHPEVMTSQPLLCARRKSEVKNREGFTCDICKFTFDNKRLLLVHFKSKKHRVLESMVVDEGMTPCCCEHCGRRFPLPRYLRQHLLRVHGIRVHKPRQPKTLPVLPNYLQPPSDNLQLPSDNLQLPSDNLQQPNEEEEEDLSNKQEGGLEDHARGLLDNAEEPDTKDHDPNPTAEEGQNLQTPCNLAEGDLEGSDFEASGDEEQNFHKHSRKQQTLSEDDDVADPDFNPASEEEQNSSESEEHSSQNQKNITVAVRGENGMYNCEICEQSYVHRKKYLKHLVSDMHQQLKAFKARKTANSQYKDVGFYCKACDHTFQKLGDMKRHVKTQVHINMQNLMDTNIKLWEEHKAKPFKCSHCGKPFRTYKLMRDHVRRIKLRGELESVFGQMPETDHNSTSPSPVGTDGKDDVSMQTTAVPGASNDDKSQYHCSDCDVTLATKQSYNKHMNSEKHTMALECKRTDQEDGSKKKSFYCDICNIYLPGSFLLVVHKASLKHEKTAQLKRENLARWRASVRRPYSCKLCVKRFSTMTGYKRHMAINIHETRAPGHKKLKMMKEMADRGLLETVDSEPIRAESLSLDRPIESQESKPDDPETADAPSSASPTSEDNQRSASGHKYDVRPNGPFIARPTHKCDTCDAEFSSIRKLITHKTVEHKIRRKCPHCPQQFTKEASLNKHIEQMHVDTTCKVCGREFPNTQGLREHTARIHDFSGEFPCTVCGKRFIRASVLKYHMNVHLGEYKYTCQFCGKAFKTRVGMRLHENHTHSETKLEFPCPICGKMFARKRTINPHIKRVHTKTRNFVCEFCGKAFHSRNGLKRHERAVHPQE